MRSFEETVRCVHLAAGFSVRPELWPVSCRYAATALSVSRGSWSLAKGSEFGGPLHALGRLVFYRNKTGGKFDPNAAPGLFAGWRIELGLRYREVALVLNYESLRSRTGAWATPINVPEVELVVPSGDPIYPLKRAADHALHDFQSPTMPEAVEPLPLPFTDGDQVSVKGKRIYITQRRLLELGPTPDCRGCEAATYNHSTECVQRFEDAFAHERPPKVGPPVIKPVECADVDEACKSFEDAHHLPEASVETCFPDVDVIDPYVSLEPTPLDHDMLPALEDPDDLVGEDPVHSPASSGYSPSIAPAAVDDLPELFLSDTEPCEISSDDEVVALPAPAVIMSGVDASRAVHHDMETLGLPASLVKDMSIRGISSDPPGHRSKGANPGSDILFEFCCSAESALGSVGKELGIKVVRLHKDGIDLSSSEAIEQLSYQVTAVPGRSIHGSLECTAWSQWQRLNYFKYPEMRDSLNRSRKASRNMLRSFVQVSEIILALGGDVSFEWPRFCAGWALPELTKWINRHQLFSVTCDGCMLGVAFKGKPCKKPWRIVTSSKRLAETLSQYQCNHEQGGHTPIQGSATRQSGFYPPKMARVILESIFPHITWKYISSMPCRPLPVSSQEHRQPHALPCLPIDLAMYEAEVDQVPVLGGVHKLLDRKEWSGNPGALAAVQSEKAGILAEGTWEEDSIIPHEELLARAKRKKVEIHVGSLMVIVSVKHFERDPSEWTLKARIVFRGDAVKNQEGLSAVFDELAASAPSSIAGLNFVIAWGQAPGHKCSTADAVKAFIQAPLSTRVETWVILPPELVPRKFSHVVRPCARLRKSLYGHPESSAHWWKHADAALQSMGGKEFSCLPSCYMFESSKMALSAYVDDFTLSGEESRHSGFWLEFGKRVKLEQPMPLTIVLGRSHQEVTWKGKKAKADDRRLARLIGYLSRTTTYALHSFMHDPLESLRLSCWVDASFGDCVSTMRSCSGYFIALEAENSFLPLVWVSRKQTVTSRSTTESETVALATAVYNDVMPLEIACKLFFGREILVKCWEDNQAVLAIVSKRIFFQIAALAKDSQNQHRLIVRSI